MSPRLLSVIEATAAIALAIAALFSGLFVADSVQWLLALYAEHFL